MGDSSEELVDELIDIDHEEEMEEGLEIDDED